MLNQTQPLNHLRCLKSLRDADGGVRGVVRAVVIPLQDERPHPQARCLLRPLTEPCFVLFQSHRKGTT